MSSDAGNTINGKHNFAYPRALAGRQLQCVTLVGPGQPNNLTRDTHIYHSKRAQMRSQRTAQRQPVFLESIEAGPGGRAPAAAAGGIKVSPPSTHCGLFPCAQVHR
jgi:hypothetical protein